MKHSISTNATSLEVDALRESFEAELRRQGCTAIERRPDGTYLQLGVEERWQGWQMAHAAPKPAPIGETQYMAGTEAFTMVCFPTKTAPPGTRIYSAPLLSTTPSTTHARNGRLPMAVWEWDGGGLRDDPEWRLSGLRQPTGKDKKPVHLVAVISGDAPMSEKLSEALNAAYFAGFEASGEGVNGELLRDRGHDPRADVDWCAKRDEAVNNIPVDPIIWAAPAVNAERAIALATRARAVFDSMLEGCREPGFGDFQNGDGVEIGPGMDALHAELRSFASSSTEALRKTDLVETLRNLGAYFGMAVVPMVPTKAMRKVLEEEDWAWEEVLAAADSITEQEYDLLAAGLSMLHTPDSGASTLSVAISSLPCATPASCLNEAEKLFYAKGHREAREAAALLADAAHEAALYRAAPDSDDVGKGGAA
jgi:hypothetical protein